MRKLAITLIRIYQVGISPYLGRNCRYEPSCSTYAQQCYTKHNFFKATYLTLYRLLRCNPFSKGGYDPIP